MNLSEFNPDPSFEKLPFFDAGSLPLYYAHLEQKGKKIFGRHFTLKPQHHLSLHKLMAYAGHDTTACEQLGVDLNKGLFICGPPQIGKTALMHLLKPFFKGAKAFQIHSCKRISYDFKQTGFRALQPFLQPRTQDSQTPLYCFDDFGTERPQSHQGTPFEVMAQLLDYQHTQFLAHGHYAHLISSLTAAAIEKRYQSPLRMQLRNMYNQIRF